ncbi:MAG: adenylate/guanylate cyclase [Verrucomicrobia bacterium]|jgi:adenylate cyclase|nr:adenylate/guanylate cyclase [Verrucomicrobiota bacterium]
MQSNPSSPAETGPIKITDSVSAAQRALPPVTGLADDATARLNLLYDLPLQFAAERDEKALYSLILNRVVDLIPGALRGALLIFEPASGKLALRASIPADNPPISRTLIKRAVSEGNGFIWSSEGEQDITKSIQRMGIRTGMYVPLLWQGNPMGVLCVDNPERPSAFSKEDLQFLVSVAHYAAAAVANQHLQVSLAQKNKTMEHLLANFSPKLRSTLLQKAQEGKLKPGGQKSQVTILLSDLRGFTRVSTGLPAEAVVEMLNDYFSALVEVVFQYDGTVDKFMGDAILAVFGSPEIDPDHSMKAVRAAIGMQAAAERVNTRRKEAGLPYCELGIGLHTGEVLHGFIGAEERLEYTVIGDTVNKASRYCDGAKGGEIVFSPELFGVLNGTLQATSSVIQTKHEGDQKAWVLKCKT